MRLSRATHLAAFLAFLAAARAGGGGGAHGGAHGGANASLGHCPHFATDNSSEFHRVCGLGGSEEPHSGHHAAFHPGHPHPRGTYVCACCGHKLFPGGAKFDAAAGLPTFWGTAGPEAVRVEKAGGPWPLARTFLALSCPHCGSRLGHLLRYGGVPPSWRRYTAFGACLAYRNEHEVAQHWYPAKLGPKGPRQGFADRARAGAKSVADAHARSAARAAAVRNGSRPRQNVLQEHLSESEYEKVMAGPLGYLLTFLYWAAALLCVLLVVLFCQAAGEKARRQARTAEKRRLRAARGEKEGGAAPLGKRTESGPVAEGFRWD